MFNDTLRKIDFHEKVKLPVDELRSGMYVCELDRPWRETPFLRQGFELNTPADIKEVKKYCDHVYIDIRLTEMVNVTLDQTSESSLLKTGESSTQNSGLETSEAALDQVSRLVKIFVKEIRYGQTPPLYLAKETVAECVSSILHQPNAMMFITKMRKNDPYNGQHAFNVCIYSIIIGYLLGLDKAQLETLGTCGLLHDIGKLAIPEHILNKRGQLTPEEKEIAQNHAVKGRDILLSGHTAYSSAAEVAYWHHEHMDGTGYPNGLQEHELSTNCRIVSVADRYDAITSHRPYRKAQDHFSAVATLHCLAKKHKIDSKVTSTLTNYLGVYPPGTIVKLNSGELGIVIGCNPDQRLRPQLLIVRDRYTEPTQRFLDMSERKVDHMGLPYRIVAVHHPKDVGINISDYYDLILNGLD